MFVSAIKKASVAMFPVFREVRNGSQASINVTGTGFFVDSKGHFVSVAHIFQGADAQTKFFFRGLIPDEVCNPPLEIREIARDDTNDIFIGKIDIDPSKFLSLLDDVADIGKSVCLAGYPLATLAVVNGVLSVTGVRRYFQPSFVLDRIALKGKIDNKEVMHDGVLVRDVGLFGMSGGPVFDIEGTVVGMQASTNTRESTNGTKTIAVENAVAIRSNLILALMKTNGISSE